MSCCASLPPPVLLVDHATQLLRPQLSDLALADDVEPTDDEMLRHAHEAICGADHLDDEDRDFCMRMRHMEQHLNSPPPGTPYCDCDAF
jgi:hypothetical protein